MFGIEKFNKFWALYPRKVAKVSAQRSWKRLTNKNIESIFNFLNAQATLAGAPPKKSVNP